MNILYFHQYFSTPSGSTGNRSYEMARRLVMQGHHVTMVCGIYKGGVTGLSGVFERGKRRGKVDGIDVIEYELAYANQDGFLKRALTFLKFAFRSSCLVFTEKYDVLFATSTPLTAGIPGILARWLCRKPFVFEVRDLWPELPKAMGVIRNPFLLMCLSGLEYITYHSAHRLIGLSPGIVEGIVKRGVDVRQIRMISNGADLHTFKTSTRACRPQGVADHDLMAIYTGTHGLANGLHAVLDAACELKRRGRVDIKLVLVGQGMLKASLHERAQKDKLDNVIFLDPMSKTQLAELMAVADLGLQILANIPAFYYGTSPNKFFDYLSAGLPVLTNYPGWLAEMINTEACGFVVKPEDAGVFADSLVFAAENREALVDMGKLARNLAEREFDREKLSLQFVDWLDFKPKARRVMPVF